VYFILNSHDYFLCFAYIPLTTVKCPVLPCCPFCCCITCLVHNRYITNILTNLKFDWKISLPIDRFSENSVGGILLGAPCICVLVYHQFADSLSSQSAFGRRLSIACEVFFFDYACVYMRRVTDWAFAVMGWKRAVKLDLPARDLSLPLTADSTTLWRPDDFRRQCDNTSRK